jgi:hypothetical protein
MPKEKSISAPCLAYSANSRCCLLYDRWNAGPLPGKKCLPFAAANPSLVEKQHPGQAEAALIAYF